MGQPNVVEQKLSDSADIKHDDTEKHQKPKSTAVRPSKTRSLLSKSASSNKQQTDVDTTEKTSFICSDWYEIFEDSNTVTEIEEAQEPSKLTVTNATKTK